MANSLAKLLFIFALVGGFGNGFAVAKGHYQTGHPKHVHKPMTLAVQGVVLCQNCTYVGTPSLHNASALPGAKVDLFCHDRRYKTFVYDTASTDNHGFFLFSLKNFDFRKHDPLKSCQVALISSPNKNCSTRTGINSGKVWGAMLRLEKASPDKILYSAGPFAFAPAPSTCIH